ncbi:N-formylglutamate amidohydrolase [Parapedobacter lycopersici]|uniref:N-formylglutamate amidohydrolase n=1 Tax=Parapedobacter lycopersici TaxID=1864939 RepID=UPI003341FBE8
MKLHYSITRAQSPIVAAAIHDGHIVDRTLRAYLTLQEHERFREEDPYTDYLAMLPVNRVTVKTSRFQLDLNRRRDSAIYHRPEDAWGLQVWQPELPNALRQELLQQYDAFYGDMAALLDDTIAAFGGFVVLDIHSYNYRRESPDAEAETAENPEINIGTAHNRAPWKTFGERFTRFLTHHRISNHPADVRENIKFGGGGFSEWINDRYGSYGCVLSLEFKKVFMDEWTGRVDIQHLNDLKQLLRCSIPYLLDMLDEKQKERPDDH